MKYVYSFLRSGMLAGAVALALAAPATGQTMVRKPCLTDEHYAEQVAANPQLVYNRDQFEAAVTQFMRNSATMRAQRGPTRIIPTVVHILHFYNFSSENISRANVIANIATLNRDMGRHNADTSQTRAIFRSRGASLDLEFRLATLDPNGDTTDGITRVESDLTDNSNPRDNLKATRIWDPTKYFNIWIVKNIYDPNATAGQYVAGYAQFPDNPNLNTYGLVVASQNTSGADRTMSHEVGHCFSLYHPFQGGCSGVNDLVDDTPPNDQAYLDCTVRNTCTNDSPDEPDMIENIMGYNTCTVMYTTGQKNRVEASIASIPHLQNLFAAANLAATGVADPYVPKQGKPVAHFKVWPLTGCAGSAFTLTDNSYNAGKDSRWTYTWTVPGSRNHTYTGQNVSQVRIDTPGVNIPITLVVTSPYGSDTLTRSLITVYAASGALAATNNTVIQQGFEDPNFPNNGYYTESPISSTWERVTTAKYEGTASYRIRNYGYGTITRTLYFPSFDLSGVAAPKLYFTRAHQRRTTSATADQLVISVSTNCGISWIVKKTLTETATTNPLYTVASTLTGAYTPLSRSDWRLDSVNLAGLTNPANVRIKFEMTSANANFLYLDDVQAGARYDRSFTTANRLNLACAGCLDLAVQPNPGTANALINFRLDNGKGTLTLTDRTGKAIATRELSGTEGHLSVSDLAHNISEGLYILRLSSAQGVAVQRLVLQKD